MKIGRKPNKYEVAIIEPGVDERDHERVTVVGDVARMNTFLVSVAMIASSVLLKNNTRHAACLLYTSDAADE